MELPVYTTDNRKILTPDEMKKVDIDLYNSITSYRYLLKDIDDTRKDIKHILKTILESNSTYFIIKTDIEDLSSTLVISKVDLVMILRKYEFNYNIDYVDYDDYLLIIELKFNSKVYEFGDTIKIDLVLSYDDLSNIIQGINLNAEMLNTWQLIQHRWIQKRLFKDLD
ncbi:hypothetical protein [Clostridium sporogenes]|uniref:hypothetical protein n=1 Tax=Clostridium sporogenes TaxID=1509 RepID=UPI000717B560|nr:hypothetical protein [Clostridium sporogenes]KRU40049.1 hypothetical protein VT94_25260 [Clostridium sporogenes]MBY7065136.1 hypothetical protein [Clostridium sporogenes]MBY7071818.1 hypothetical protein [Clostridium sporogenes]MCW6065876.1 hypothetical protein [Clostridium sporogenes]OQP88553.1 hypothetical protein VT93_0201970 [Clostridium sporogenes]